MNSPDAPDDLERPACILVARADAFIGDAVTERCRRSLSADERARELRYVQPRDRVLSRLGHALVRHALAQWTGTAAIDFEIERDDLGKPFLRSGPHFNLSHTRGLVAVVVGPSPCGIDAETRDRSFELQPLAERYFARSEIAWLEALPSHHRADGFLRLWTVKEAWLKATGKGLRVPLHTVEVDLTGARPRLTTPEDSRPATQWTLQSWPFEDSHHLAVAIAGATRDPIVRSFDPVDLGP